MKKIKIKFIKGLFICSQKDLLELKELITQRIEKTETAVLKAIQRKDLSEWSSYYNLLKELRKDLEKVKRKISLNNVLFRISPLVYQRERFKKQLESIIKQHNECKSSKVKNHNTFVYLSDKQLEKEKNELKQNIKKFDIIRNKKNERVKTIIRLKTI